MSVISKSITDNIDTDIIAIYIGFVKKSISGPQPYILPEPHRARVTRVSSAHPVEVGGIWYVSQKCPVLPDQGLAADARRRRRSISLSLGCFNKWVRVAWSLTLENQLHPSKYTLHTRDTTSTMACASPSCALYRVSQSLRFMAQ